MISIVYFVASKVTMGQIFFLVLKKESIALIGMDRTLSNEDSLYALSTKKTPPSDTHLAPVPGRLFSYCPRNLESSRSN